MHSEKLTSWRSLLDGALEFVYPRLCLLCDSGNVSGAEIICDDCWRKATSDAHIRCLFCRQPIDESLKCEVCEESPSIPVIILGHYKNPLKEIVHQFKYHGYYGLAETLANRLIDKHLTAIEKVRPTLVVPVPLDSFRMRMRGFNQSALMSDIISKRLHIAAAGELLTKSRRTKDQTKLDFEKRAENLKGAFKVIEETKPGERTILIDDVITTGATLCEAVRALKEAGGQVVMAAAIAAADR